MNDEKEKLELELELIQIQEAEAAAQATTEPGMASRAWEAANAPLPYLGAGVEKIRTGIPGHIVDEVGKMAPGDGIIDQTIRGGSIATAGVIGMTGELLPKSPLDVALTVAAGPIGKGIGKMGSALLPPIEKRAPNAVRAVKAAMSANILPTIPQITQSPAWASVEEVTSVLPWFGRRIKAMRQAQEAAYQELRTSAVKSSGPEVVADTLGTQTRKAVFGEVEALEKARNKELELAKNKILKAGGKPVTPEAAALHADEIRMAKTEEARLTAGKHYDEVAEMVPPDVDKVTDSRIKGEAEKWLKDYENLPNASLDPRARKLLEDIKSGPGNKIIENAPDPFQEFNPLVMGESAVPEAAKAIMERKTYTFKEAQTLRSTLNGMIQQEVAKAPSGGGSVELRIYKSLKNSLDADISNFGDSLSGDMKDKFDVATAYYRDHYKAIYANSTMKNLAQLSKEKPGAVFDSLVGRGNVVDIKRLKAAVGEPGFSPMRRLAVERLVTSPEGRILSGPEITKNLAAYGDEALKEVLTPTQLAEVSKYRTTRELPKFIESEMEKKLRGVIFEREGVFRAPEDVVKRIVNGDTATLRAVKKIVGPKGTDQYRRLIIEDIVGEAFDPSLLPNQQPGKTAFKIGKALREYDEAFRREIFSDKALSEIEKIDDIKALMESQARLKSNAFHPPHR